MKCVLHIGTEKTGSTYLQRALRQNKSLLEKYDVYLADSLESPNNRLLPALFQAELDDWSAEQGCRVWSDHEQRVLELIPSVREEFEGLSKKSGTLFLTSEHCHSRLQDPSTIKRLQNFLARYFREIVVVGFFRNQADMAVSYYSTLVKGAYAKSLEDFISESVNEGNYYFNFEQISSAWAEAFGVNACRFRSYDRIRTSQENILTNLLSEAEAEVSDAELNLEVDERNLSLTAIQASLFSAINSVFPYLDTATFSQATMNKLLKSSVRDWCTTNSQKLSVNRKEILERFQQSNERFSQRFFAEANIFREKYEDEDLRSVGTDSAMEEVLRAVACVLDPKRLLSESDVDLLRDTAIGIENSHPMAALSLMSICARARPDGALISKKIKEYRRHLA